MGAQSWGSKKRINVLSTCYVPAAFPPVHLPSARQLWRRVCLFSSDRWGSRGSRGEAITSTSQATDKPGLDLGLPAFKIHFTHLPSGKTFGICFPRFSEARCGRGEHKEAGGQQQPLPRHAGSALPAGDGEREDNEPVSAYSAWVS